MRSKTTKQLLTDFLVKLQVRIVSNQAFLGIRASGKSAESLRAETSILMGRIYGEDYFEYQERGRGPGGPPPFFKIRKWIDDKRITPRRITKDSLAWAIRAKIAKRGTRIYRKESPPLPLSEIFRQEMPNLRKDIIDKYTIDFRNEVRGGFRNAS